MTIPEGVVRLSTRAQVIEHAKHLLDPDREHPVVVVTTKNDGTSLIDAQLLAEELAGVAEVALLPTGPLTYESERHLPPLTHVYGGATRVYPASTDWHTAPYSSRLLLCYEEEEVEQVTRRTLQEARRHAQRRQVSTEKAKPTAVTGTVAMVISPDRALVRIDEDRTVVASTEGIAGDLDVEQILRPGMEVRGRVSPGGTDMTLELDRLPVSQALQGVAVGQRIPALVTSTDAKTAVVSLLPGMHTRTDRLAGVRVDDVVAVLVEQIGRTDGQGWSLTMLEGVNPSTASKAPALYDGGPPWLVLPEPQENVEPEPAPQPDREEAGLARTPTPADISPANTSAGTSPSAPSAPSSSRSAPLPGPASTGPLRAELEQTRRTLAEVTRERRDLRDERARHLAELDEIAQENAHLRTELERLRNRKAPSSSKVRQLPTQPTDDSNLFLDPEEQLRFEIHLAWARRIPAAEKAERPLASYSLGEDFLESLDSTQGVDRSKVVDVIVEVLTGLADILPGRELHQLRQGGPGTPTHTHPELGTAWRASIQVKTASARRLHFWRGNDGHVTLAQVGVHDDMRISA